MHGVWTQINPLTEVLASIGDPDGTRTVTSIVGLLVALGLALTMVAVWVYRTTRPDPELLAPLEVMGERRWRRADPVAQRRTLDAVRPEGAEPLAPSVAPPVIDETFDAGPTAPGFDDLGGEEDSDMRSLRPARAPIWPPVGEVTPRAIDRPEVDTFGDVFSHDIDPEVLAAAAADLDAELERSTDAAPANAAAANAAPGEPADRETVDARRVDLDAEVRSEADAE